MYSFSGAGRVTPNTLNDLLLVMSPMGGVLQGVLGIFLFITSRALSERWFKNEEG